MKISCSFCGKPRSMAVPIWGGSPVSQAFICLECVKRFGALSTDPSKVGEVQVGTVKKWLEEKGHGIIEGPQGDVWVSFSAVEGEGYRALQPGKPVQFKAISQPMGSFTLYATWARQLKTDQ